MEENQNSNSDEFTFSENGKKKKGMGPLKGLLIALVMVFLIIVIGLLIRMVVAGDGDYFKPFKEIFGIETEDDEDNGTKEKTSDKASLSDTSFSSSRYLLLSDEVENENVKHYRMTIDVKDMVSKLMDQAYNTYDLNGNEDSYSDEYDNTLDNEDSYNTFDSEDSYSDNMLDDESSDDYYSNDDVDSYSSDDESSISSEFENIMGTLSFMMGFLEDMIDGEIYFDVYFEGNEIVQVVLGYDYEKFIENYYESALDDEDAMSELEEEGIESVEDFKEYISSQFDQYLDKDYICDLIMDNEDTKKELDQLGIKEKDIKDAIDINNDAGLVEFYLNGTTKVKALISMALESSEFQQDLEDVEEENDFTFDEDNIIESFFELVNETEEYQEMGIEFVEVR